MAEDLGSSQSASSQSASPQPSSPQPSSPQPSSPRVASSIAVRLVRHSIRLGNGQHAGVATAGWGVPLVVVNGFAAEGVLYAQTTSRLVSMGMKIVSIDSPGHGDSEALSPTAASIDMCARFVADTMDALGIGPCLMLGHSMGGRVAAHLAVTRPDQVCGLVLVDPILGRTWDRTVASLRVPPNIPGLVAAAVGDMVDCLSPRDRSQAAVVARALGRTSLHHLRRPWRMVGPGLAILRATSSAEVLGTLAGGPTRLLIIHGDNDRLVPLQTAIDARQATDATLVVIEGAGHNWILKDPELLAAIVGEQLRGGLGDAYTEVLSRAGLDPAAATVVDMEFGCYAEDALIRMLSPDIGFALSHRRHRPVQHRWHTWEQAAA